MKVYSVFDKVGNFYCTPFFCISDAVACRMFGDAVADPVTAINKHPDDYDLYLIGDFDDSTGLIKSFEPVVFVSRASNFLPKGTQDALQD